MKTNQTDKATARPWQVQKQDAFGDWVIQSGQEGGYGVIATTNPHGIESPEANAALIVKAVNEHAALVAVAEAAQWAEEHVGSIQEVKEALANLAAVREGGAK